MDPLFDRTVPRRDVRTPWGWTRWYAVPGRDDLIHLHQIGVIPPNPPRSTRFARRWLTRRPATLLDIASERSHRTILISATTAFVAVGSMFLFGKLLLAGYLPGSIALPLMLVPPLLGEFLPPQIDRWARRRAVVIDTPASVRGFAHYLQLQADLDAAADESGLAECRAAAQIGRELLWDLAVAEHEYGHPTYAAAEAEQLEQLACAAAKACAAAWELDRHVRAAPAAPPALDVPRNPEGGQHFTVDQVARDLQEVTDAQLHAANVLASLDGEQAADWPSADGTTPSRASEHDAEDREHHST